MEYTAEMGYNIQTAKWRPQMKYTHLCNLSLHHLLRNEVSFIANQQFVHVFTSVSVNL